MTLVSNDGPNKVKDARIRAGLTQRELALKAGLPPATIGRIELGLAVTAEDLHAAGIAVATAAILLERSGRTLAT